MPALTDEGRRVIDGLVQRHGFSPEATEHMLFAVLNGNCQMAQFSHWEFGGSGQWMRGGMTMIGDMFNNQLKGRVDSLCSDIASTLNSHGVLFQSGSFQSQSQGSDQSQRQDVGPQPSPSNLFVPNPSENWWPQDLGRPNATGSQNQMRYAYFGDARRLAVKTGDSVWVYDTLNHQIGGFSQQQGGSGGISFSSQFGTVELSSLPVVLRDGQTVSKSVESSSEPLRDNRTANLDPVPASQPSQPKEGDIIAMLERLGGLRTMGILTDEEFNAKKKELLARI